MTVVKFIIFKQRIHYFTAYQALFIDHHGGGDFSWAFIVMAS